MTDPALLASRSLRPAGFSAPSAGAVVFFPYAGGVAASGRRLLEHLDGTLAGLAVQYPGKGDRKQEAEPHAIEDLAADIVEDLAQAGLLAGPPLTLYGHSMGAAVAFETALQLEAGGHVPRLVCVSGRRAPSVSLGFTLPLSDAVILRNIEAGAGVPAEVLRNPKFRDALIAGVRNDYTMNVTYHRPPEATLRAPLRFLLSDADPYVDEAAALAWRAHAAGAFDLLHFQGGHFFIDQNLDAVARALRQG